MIIKTEEKTNYMKKPLKNRNCGNVEVPLINMFDACDMAEKYYQNDFDALLGCFYRCEKRNNYDEFREKYSSSLVKSYQRMIKNTASMNGKLRNDITFQDRKCIELFDEYMLDSSNNLFMIKKIYYVVYSKASMDQLRKKVFCLVESPRDVQSKQVLDNVKDVLTLKVWRRVMLHYFFKQFAACVLSILIVSGLLGLITSVYVIDITHVNIFLLCFVVQLFRFWIHRDFHIEKEMNFDEYSNILKSTISIKEIERLKKSINDREFVIRSSQREIRQKYKYVEPFDFMKIQGEYIRETQKYTALLDQIINKLKKQEV